MLLWTGGKWIEGLPAGLKQLSAPVFLGISAIGWFTLVLALLMAWLLAKTAFGRNFYATGDNLQGARQLGCPVPRWYASWHFHLMAVWRHWLESCLPRRLASFPNQTGTGWK
ncbi:ABC transporter permease [Salmonella enterica subsp. enterica]|nr:ABC transporter permease [Salmonella enterica subsp. enterica]